ncbi:SNARE-interacting protein KEULE [Glycine soja]
MTTFHDLIPAKLVASVWDCLMKYKKTIPNFPQTKTCELLIIDTTIDEFSYLHLPIAPVIHEWTYDAMCRDLSNMEGNKYVHEIDGPPKRKEVLLDDHDPIWLICACKSTNMEC